MNISATPTEKSGGKEISLSTDQHKLPKILLEAGKSIDHLVTTDVPLRGVIGFLYRHARERTELPLTLAAAQALTERLKGKTPVFIATGWLDRPHIALEIGETDGPPGAAVLGRALQRACKSVPFFFVEESLVLAMSSVVEAAGLKVLSPEAAMRSVDSQVPIHGATILDFPADATEAARLSHELIRRYEPAAVISVEKGGMNCNGAIHTSRGDDTTEHLAKVDLLMREAERCGIMTVGIGDGGNEIGMGLIQDAIREGLPFGETIAPATKTDYLVTATVSNWGAYGIAACLAVLLGQREVFHDAQLEQRILHRCANAGLIDGISGYVEEGVDGLSAKVHVSLVTMLGELVRQALLHLGKE